MIHRHRLSIIAFATKYRLATISPFREFAEEGGLMAYGPQLPDLLRRAAGLIDKILRGEQPANLPVEQPTTFEMIINLKTARELGIVVPPTLLVRADEVIE
jgi:putative tryptophan/tyrosine transport system substrate-binding protein